jgi:hypothetical protein
MANMELEKLVNRWTVAGDAVSQAQDTPPTGEDSNSPG